MQEDTKSAASKICHFCKLHSSWEMLSQYVLKSNLISISGTMKVITHDTENTNQHVPL